MRFIIEAGKVFEMTVSDRGFHVYKLTIDPSLDKSHANGHLWKGTFSNFAAALGKIQEEL